MNGLWPQPQVVRVQWVARYDQVLHSKRLSLESYYTWTSSRSSVIDVGIRAVFLARETIASLRLERRDEGVERARAAVVRVVSVSGRPWRGLLHIYMAWSELVPPWCGWSAWKASIMHGGSSAPPQGI